MPGRVGACASFSRRERVVCLHSTARRAGSRGTAGRCRVEWGLVPRFRSRSVPYAPTRLCGRARGCRSGAGAQGWRWGRHPGPGGQQLGLRLRRVRGLAPTLTGRAVGGHLRTSHSPYQVCQESLARPAGGTPWDDCLPPARSAGIQATPDCPLPCCAQDPDGVRVPPPALRAGPRRVRVPSPALRAGPRRVRVSSPALRAGPSRV